MFLVMVNKHNILDELILVTTDREKAQQHFLDTCQEHLSNWDDYTQDDKNALLDMGYEQLVGEGAIVLVDTDGITSDGQIAAEIHKTVPPMVNKITRWISSGEIGEEKTVGGVIEKAGRLLDKSCSEELFGQVIFEAEDGNTYVLNCEGCIGQINPEYLEDMLLEQGHA